MPRQMFNLGSGLGSALFGDPSVMMDAQMKANQMQMEQQWRDQQLAIQKQQEARLAAQAEQSRQIEQQRIGIAQEQLELQRGEAQRAAEAAEIARVKEREAADKRAQGYGASQDFGSAFTNLYNSQGTLNKAIAADQAYVPSAGTVAQYSREGVDTNVPSYEALNVIPGARRAVEDARPRLVETYGGMISAAPDVTTAADLAIKAANPEAGIVGPWQNSKPSLPRPYESTADKLRDTRNVETENRIYDAGRVAYSVRSDISLLKQATKDVNLGPAAPYMGALAGVMQQFGVDPAAIGLDPNLVTVQDMLKTFNAKFVTDALAGGKFPTQNFSNADKVFLQQMFPDIGDTPLGLEIKLEVFDRIAQADQAKADALRQFLATGQGTASDFEYYWAATADQRPSLFGDLAQRIEASKAEARRIGAQPTELPPAGGFVRPAPAPGFAPPQVQGAAPYLGGAPNRATAYRDGMTNKPRILDIRVVE